MTSPQTSQRRLPRMFTPIIGGLIVILALVAAIALRGRLWSTVKSAGHGGFNWFTDWVPAHPHQAGAIGGFALIALGLNWISHVRGRLYAWIFAIVVEAGLWLLFWKSVFIPPLKDLLKLNVGEMPLGEVAKYGVAVIALTGVVFWILEAREEWKKFRAKASG